MRYLKIGVYFPLISVLFMCTACSPDLDNMTVKELALHHAERFERDSIKDSYRKPLAVLNYLEIKPGMIIVDLFGGGGYYTELLSYIVGTTGLIYVQNHPAYLKHFDKELTERLLDNRLSNTQRIDSQYTDLKLPENVDLIFIALAFHDIYATKEESLNHSNSKLFYQQVMKALKPGGRVVVLDHSGVIGSTWKATPKLHRIDETWTRKMFEENGFDFVSESNVLRNPSDD